jgi:hypothetical protein
MSISEAAIFTRLYNGWEKTMYCKASLKARASGKMGKSTKIQGRNDGF